MAFKEQDTTSAYSRAPVWSAACNTPLCKDPPLSQPGHIKMTPSLSASVKLTPAQTPTPIQARSGHRRISANMQDLALCTAHHHRPGIKGCSRQAGVGVGLGRGRHPPDTRRVTGTGGPTRLWDRAIPPRRLSRRFLGPRALAEPDTLPRRQMLPAAPQPLGSVPHQPAGP